MPSQNRHGEDNEWMTVRILSVAIQPHPVWDVLMAAVSAAADIVDVLHEGLHVLHGHIPTP